MSFKAFCLLLILILGGTYTYIKLQADGNPNSSFNQSTRYLLGKHPFWRSIFSLHNAGDERAEYLFGSGPIAIHFINGPATNLNQNVEQEFAQAVQKYTGRLTVIINNGTAKSGVMADQDVDSIITTEGTYNGTASNLYVIVAENFSNSGAAIAETYQDNGIIIAYDSVVKLTMGYSQSQDLYYEAALLHEFGKQLGLPTSNEEGCIMNQSVESPDPNQVGLGQSTSVDFCQTEINELATIKTSLQ